MFLPPNWGIVVNDECDGFGGFGKMTHPLWFFLKQTVKDNRHKPSRGIPNGKCLLDYN